jgi:hypothetical protein
MASVVWDKEPIEQAIVFLEGFALLLAVFKLFKHKRAKAR